MPTWKTAGYTARMAAVFAVFVVCDKTALSANPQSGTGQTFEAIRARMASYEGGHTTGLCAKQECGEGCSANCCTGGGIMAQADLMFLKAHESEGSAETSRYDAAYRLSASWEGKSGTGARVRWFEYNTDTNDEDYNVYGIDAELTGSYQLNCNWSGLLALGVRHSKFEEVDDNDVRAWGPSIAGELRRPLFGEIDLFGSARYAALFGADKEDNFDTTNAYAELQIGLECQRCVGDSVVFARAAVEGQRWIGGANDDTQDLGLFGGTFSIGTSY